MWRRLLALMVVLGLSATGRVWAQTMPTLEPNYPNTIINSGGGPVTALSVTIPSAYHVGDCLFLYCAMGGYGSELNGGAFAVPPGWHDYVETGGGGPYPGNYPAWANFYKIATAADLTGSNTVTCGTVPSGAPMTAALFATINNNQSSCIDLESNQFLSEATQIVVPAVLAQTMSNDLAIAVTMNVWGAVTYSGQTSSRLGSMTDYAQDGFTDVASIGPFTFTNSSTGSFTNNSSTYAGMSMDVIFVPPLAPTPTPTPTRTPTPTVTSTSTSTPTPTSSVTPTATPTPRASVIFVP